MVMMSDDVRISKAQMVRKSPPHSPQIRNAPSSVVVMIMRNPQNSLGNYLGPYAVLQVQFVGRWPSYGVKYILCGTESLLRPQTLNPDV